MLHIITSFIIETSYTPYILLTQLWNPPTLKRFGDNLQGTNDELISFCNNNFNIMSNGNHPKHAEYLPISELSNSGRVD